jgi:hypothetical protein
MKEHPLLLFLLAVLAITFVRLGSWIAIFFWRKHSCEECGKWLSVSYSSTGHQYLHTGELDEEEDLRKCSACGVAHKRKRLMFSSLSYADPSDWSKC